MRQIILITLGAFVAVGALAALLLTGPESAEATIHEITQSECAGPGADFKTADLQTPPGLTGGSNADNFAQPLEALVANGQLQGSGVFVEPFPGAGFEIEILVGTPAKSTGEEHCRFPETNAHPDSPDEVSS
ncbi:MAG TPA: hypothetical protein VGR43_02750 [Dehalococcoidia bacterium]|nr:hypothetical protein [Dehalococcoidia bacterium]